ncbi:MAG: bifunctional phosphoribosylaminoimidazolecarboxamide formyltransferase/IMP cyclohydrolase [Candidatus Aenigmarchaeota archaeon]|nr:bifunctional phosphoribosylaminoimidazolecarboxamide formyltransferase/IMP cyclohydrolase [Candidatus Aenigmarchaeota archaeon]
MIKKALVSVTDKTGIVDFSKALAEMGVQIISTGGTAKILKENGVPVTYIGDYTGFPEVMDGRVRTLHPKIHGGILAVRKNAEHASQMKEHGIEEIGMVVVNLYQFEKTVAKENVDIDEAIENIDIGGPTLIRSAAKNYKDVIIVTDPCDYDSIISDMKQGSVSLEKRQSLALKAFRRTADYDAGIDKFLSKRFAGEDIVRMKFLNGKQLRYGENWHQKAKVFSSPGGKGLVSAKQLHGKDMSYNNYVDAESAIDSVSDLKGTGVSIIKHNNPCGFATGGSLREAMERAWEGDPVSAFGSVIAVNRPFDLATAEFLKGKFVEVVIAPSFEKDALEFLMEKSKDIRLLQMDFGTPEKDSYRIISGGLLQQDRDIGYADKKEFRTVTEKAFPEDKKDLALFACLATKHTKSNSIIIAREYSKGLFQVLGMGAGQPNRVDSLRKLAVTKAKENMDIFFEKEKPGISREEYYKKTLVECVMGSDSFFPFDDSVKEAAKEGIRFIVQPGGSVRDEEIIKTANDLGVSMTFTGRRMFKH